MAILTNSGRLYIARIMQSMPYFLAWGTGDETWDNDFIQPTSMDTALVNEIGRRAANVVEFCMPAADGSIDVPSGTYTPSDMETLYIHLRFDFMLADSPGEIIRECGVFAGTEINDDVPESTHYYLPEHVKSPGSLIMVERFAALNLAVDFRRSFDFVITL